MKFYFACKFQRKLEAQLMVSLIHERTEAFCNARWLGLETEAASDEMMRRYAIADRDDVLTCDLFILLSEESINHNRGGRLVELGMAIGAKKKILVIGPKETIFGYLPELNFVRDIEEAIVWINKL